MSVAWPWKPPDGWCTMIRLFGSEKRMPLAPAVRSSDPAEAACPTQSVETGGRMYCMVSYIDRPEVTTPPGAVDVHGDFLLRILRLEKQQLRHDQRRHAVVDRPGDEDDPLLEQPRENVVGTLAPGGLFDHHRHEVHVGLDRIFIEVLPFPARGSRRCAPWLRLRNSVPTAPPQGPPARGTGAPAPGRNLLFVHRRDARIRCRRASAGRHRKRRALCHLTPLAHRYYLREIESLARARQPHHWSAWLLGAGRDRPRRADAPYLRPAASRRAHARVTSRPQSAANRTEEGRRWKAG